MGVPAIKLPNSPFVDISTGNVSREWRQWLLNPQFISLNLDAVLAIGSGGTGVGTIPANGQILIGNGTGYTLASLTAGVSIGIVSGAGSITLNVQNIDASLLTSGALPAGRFPALTGDITTVAGALGTTLATVNGGPGSFGANNRTVTLTVNGKGLVTASSDQLISILNTQVTGLGTLSTQNATAAAITGGSIDGTILGASTPATVKGTTITATGAFGCNGKTAQASATVNAAIAGSAGAAYTATEQGLINSLLALTNQLRAALVANGITV